MAGEYAATMSALVRETLLRLARFEEDVAAAEAAVPYWVPVPDSVRGHQIAAAALRAEADAFGDGAFLRELAPPPADGDSGVAS